MMPAPVKRTRSVTHRPLQTWRPGKDVSATDRDDAETRADKDRKIAEFLAKKESPK